MKTIDTVQPHHGVRATRGIEPSSVQQVPSTDFSRFHVLADGDCLFRGIHMGQTNQPGVEGSNEQIMALRHAAAQYVTQHQSELVAHTSFGGEAGVHNLYALLMTQGQWNNDAGDLVLPIMAKVLGRQLRVLEPTNNGQFYEANDNRFYRPQTTELPAGKADTGQPPLYLLRKSTKHSSHYEYLTPRTTQLQTHSQAMPSPGSGGQDSPDRDSRGSMASLHSFKRRSVEKILDRQASDAENKPTGLPRRGSDSDISVSSLHAFERMSDEKQLEQLVNDAENNPTGQPRRGSDSVKSMSTSEWFDGLGFENDNNPSDKTMRRPSLDEGTSENDWIKAFADSTGYIDAPKVGQPPLLGGPLPNYIEVRTPLSNEGDQEVNPTRAEAKKKRKRNGDEIRAVRSELGSIKVKQEFDKHNKRPFETLTPDEQNIEVERISSAVNYTKSSVRSVLSGKGIKVVLSNKAMDMIKTEFAKNNKGNFEALTEQQKTEEVNRIARVTGYKESGVLATLSGKGMARVTHKSARNTIMAAYDRTNTRDFNELTKDEQNKTVDRISRGTGYKSSRVQAVLLGIGTNQILRNKHKVEILTAFTNHGPNRNFNALPHTEQDAEVARISGETGYNPTGVRRILIAEPEPIEGPETRTAQPNGGDQNSSRAETQVKAKKRVVRSDADSLKVQQAFNKRYNGSFETLTPNEQNAEVERISSETNYAKSSVRSLLSRKGIKAVLSNKAMDMIKQEFAKNNSGSFDALTEQQQTEESSRIARETGYRQHGIIKTLSGEGVKRVTDKSARNSIIDVFKKTNARNFSELTADEQNKEVDRISRQTGYQSTRVQTVLLGIGTSKIRNNANRNEIITAFNGNGDGRSFSALPQTEQDAEVLRISKETGYNPVGVRRTLEGGQKNTQSK